MVGELADAEDQPEHHGEQDRAERHLQGDQQPVDEQRLDVGGGDERLPQLVLELAVLVEPPDDEGQRRRPAPSDRDHGVDPVPGDRSPGRARRRGRWPAIRRSSSVARAGSRRRRRSRPGPRRSGRRRGRSRPVRPGSLLVKTLIRKNASATPKTPQTVVFLSSAICTLASGGTDARNACGSTTWRHRPAERQPDRAGRLGLAERDRVDAGAERLADERRGVDRQRDDAGREEVVDAGCRRSRCRRSRS